MTTLTVRSGRALTGRCYVPGDKSISHRAVMFASIAEGISKIHNFLDGADCRATIDVVRALGVQVDVESPTELVIHGRGLHGLQEPSDLLYCANSGTTIRLMTGLLAGQRFASFLTGTAQIRRRPMGRIVQPLRGMGADIMGRQNGNYAPLGIRPAQLRGVEYDLPVASAQVKSCILLAGMYSNGLTVVREPGPARDHTERLLKAMGAPIYTWGNTIHSERPSTPLEPIDLSVPGDLSSAAYLIAAASIVPGSRIEIADVGVNPTRIGIVDALVEMGAQIVFHNRRDVGGEPVADVEIRTSELQGTTLGGKQIVTLIDELPVLAVAATQAHGKTVIRDAHELRVKETDRIATTVSELRKLGADIEPTDDGFVVNGPTRLVGGPVDSLEDHRLAMAMSVAGLVANGTTNVYGAEVTDDSFPGFDGTLRALGVERSAVEMGETMSVQQITGKTTVVGLIGWPVSHSISPPMHNAAFDALGLDWRYVPLPVDVAPAGRIGEAVAGLRGLGLRGANVTVPHKQAVMPYLDRLTPAAQAIGAVNTIVVNEDGSLLGDNTDARGFVADILAHDVALDGSSVIILGAGGSARAVLYGLAEAGCSSIRVLNRTVVRARRLVEELQPLFPDCSLNAFPAASALADIAAESTLIVNCTSLGMTPEVAGLPWEAQVPFRRDQTVYDLVYNPPRTRLLEKAESEGAQAISGLGMLVWQGAIAFSLWTGMEPPVDQMKRAALAAFGR